MSRIKKSKFPGITMVLYYGTVVKLRSVGIRSMEELLGFTSAQFLEKGSTLDKRVIRAAVKRMIAKNLFFQDGEEATKAILTADKSKSAEKKEAPIKIPSPEDIFPKVLTLEEIGKTLEILGRDIIGANIQQEDFLTKIKFKAKNGREYLVSLNIVSA